MTLGTIVLQDLQAVSKQGCFPGYITSGNSSLFRLQILPLLGKQSTVWGPKPCSEMQTFSYACGNFIVTE